MKKMLLLTGAILAEVTGTLALRGAVDHPAWAPAVVIPYITAFILIGLTLREGMPIGAVYGIWGAAGVALVAALSIVIFNETLSPTALLGISFIIVGVVFIETGAPHAPLNQNHRAPQ